MPVVPSDFVQTVMPAQGQPGSRPEEERYFDIKASPEMFGGQVGATLQQAGGMLERHAVERQQLANETNVNDVYANQFSPQFRAIRDQFLKLEGKDAEAQFPAYEAQMNDLRAQYRAALPNDMQRMMFDVRSTRRAELELDGMARYAVQQTKAWQWNTHRAVIDDFISEAEANWNNPEHLENVQSRLDDQLIDYGSKHGWSTEIYQGQRRGETDALWEAVIRRYAISGDSAGASRVYQEQNQAGRLSGQAQGRIEQFLRPFQENASAQRAFSIATGGPVAQRIASEAQRQGVDPNTALTIWAAEGTVTAPRTRNGLGSPAVGHFQFMPGTWADMGGTDQDRFASNRQIELGVQLVKQNTQKLQQDLGRQPQPWEVYLAHQQGIKGAEALMSADPDSKAVQIVGNPKAIALNGGTPDMSAGQFLTMIKSYADRCSQLYDPQGLPTAQNIRENYQLHEDAIRQQARADYPGDPTMQDKYMSEYEKHAGVLLRADRMANQANIDTINAGISGPNGAKSWQDAMRDPKWAQAYVDVSGRNPSVYDRVDKAIRANALGAWDPAPTAESNALHDELLGMQTTDRQRFANMDLMTYYGAMPVNQLNGLIADQAVIRKQDQAQAAKQVGMARVEKLMEPVLREAGDLNMHPDSSWRNVSRVSFGPALQKYNQFVGQLSTAIDAWRQNNSNKIPSDSDIIQIGRGILFPGEQAKPSQFQAAPKAAETAAVQAQAEPEHREDHDPFSLWIADKLREARKAVTRTRSNSSGKPW
jgi:hypothetical protein